METNQVGPDASRGPCVLDGRDCPHYAARAHGCIAGYAKRLGCALQQVEELKEDIAAFAAGGEIPPQDYLQLQETVAELSIDNDQLRAQVESIKRCRVGHKYVGTETCYVCEAHERERKAEARCAVAVAQRDALLETLDQLLPSAASDFRSRLAALEDSEGKV